MYTSTQTNIVIKKYDFEAVSGFFLALSTKKCFFFSKCVLDYVSARSAREISTKLATYISIL